MGRKTTTQLNQYVRFEFCLWFILPGGWTDIMALCVGGPRRIYQRYISTDALPVLRLLTRIMSCCRISKKTVRRRVIYGIAQKICYRPPQMQLRMVPNKGSVAACLRQCEVFNDDLLIIYCWPSQWMNSWEAVIVWRSCWYNDGSVFNLHGSFFAPPLLWDCIELGSAFWCVIYAHCHYHSLY